MNQAIKKILTIAVLIFAFLLLINNRTHANVGGIWWNPSMVSKPLQSKKTNIIVKKEILTFDCFTVGTQLSCSFKAEYNVHNPTGEEETALCAFYGILSKNVTITINGKNSEKELSKKEVEALDTSIPGINKKIIDTRKGFLLTLKPKEDKKIIITGIIKNSGNRRWGLVDMTGPALKMKHPFFNTYPKYHSHDIAYFISPIKSWKRVDEIEIIVNYSDTHNISTRFLNRFPDSRGRRMPALETIKDARWRTSSNGHIIQKRWRGKNIPSNYLFLRLKEKKNRVHSGGIFLRTGLDFENTARFRMGFGYEFSFPHWIIYSLSAESNFYSHITIVPLAEISTPALILMSCSFGIGAPSMIRFKKKNSIGIRFQPAFHFGPLGLIVPMDYYPGLKKNDGERFQVSLFLQMSF